MKEREQKKVNLERRLCRGGSEITLSTLASSGGEEKKKGRTMSEADSLSPDKVDSKSARSSLSGSADELNTTMIEPADDHVEQMDDGGGWIDPHAGRLKVKTRPRAVMIQAKEKSFEDDSVDFNSVCDQLTEITKGKMSLPRFTRDGRMVIDVPTTEDVNALVAVTDLGNLKVRCWELTEKTEWKGKIVGVPPSYSDKMLLNTLRIAGVTKIERVMRRVPGAIAKAPTGTVIVSFGKPDLPVSVRIGHVMYAVVVYEGGAVQCHRCYKYGHMMRSCTEEVLCKRCGGKGHLIANCSKKEDKCVNCGGPHMSTYFNCPTRHAEAQLKKKITASKIEVSHDIKIPLTSPVQGLEDRIQVGGKTWAGVVKNGTTGGPSKATTAPRQSAVKRSAYSGDIIKTIMDALLPVIQKLIHQYVELSVGTSLREDSIPSADILESLRESLTPILGSPQTTSANSTNQTPYV